MALWDIIEAIFGGAKKVYDSEMDRTYEKIDKMESEVNKYQVKADRICLWSFKKQRVDSV